MPSPFQLLKSPILVHLIKQLTAIIGVQLRLMLIVLVSFVKVTWTLDRVLVWLRNLLSDRFFKVLFDWDAQLFYWVVGFLLVTNWTWTIGLGGFVNTWGYWIVVVHTLLITVYMCTYLIIISFDTVCVVHTIRIVDTVCAVNFFIHMYILYIVHVVHCAVHACLITVCTIFCIICEWSDLIKISGYVLIGLIYSFYMLF